MQNKWKIDNKMPEFTKNMIVEDAMEVEAVSKNIDMIFCAVNLDKKELVELE